MSYVAVLWNGILRTNLPAFLLVALLGSTAVPVQSHAASVAPDRQAIVLLRVLAYDRNLESRIGDKLVVGVLHAAGNSSSERQADAVMAGFETVRAKAPSVRGLPLSLVKLAYTGAGSLLAAMKAKQLGALYVVPGLEGSLPTIRDAARASKVVTMGSDEGAVKRGLSLAIVSVKNRPKIFLNLAASKGEGAVFSSELIRLAQIVE